MKQDGWLRLCLVSTPGPICLATCATLAHTPRVKLVAVASGALSATEMLPMLHPDIVLLDANVPEDEVCALLRWMVEHGPGVHCVVAAMTSAQLQQALAFGADMAVRRDELPTLLKRLADSLLADEGN